jgi:hypothetical protein
MQDRIPMPIAQAGQIADSISLNPYFSRYIGPLIASTVIGVLQSEFWMDVTQNSLVLTAWL